VIAQRLVRRLADSKEKYFLDAVELASLAKLVDIERILKILIDEKIVPPKATWKQVPFFKPKQSADAEDGYKGRIGIHEVLKMSPTVKELVMRGETADKIEVQAKKEGMITMLEDGIFKAVQGETTIEEVLRVVTE
jgi:type IV pilus assembly protein PilB